MKRTLLLSVFLPLLVGQNAQVQGYIKCATNLFKGTNRNPMRHLLCTFFTFIIFLTVFTQNSFGSNLLESNFYIDEDIKEAQLLIDELRKIEKPNVFHLISHGRPGALMIEGRWLSNEELVSWMEANIDLNEVEHLNIYGCNFARGARGANVVEYLEESLGVAVAASDDLTGIGGDWDLEIGSTSYSISPTDYKHRLQSGFVDCATILSQVGPRDGANIKIVDDKIYIAQTAYANSPLPVVNGNPSNSSVRNIYVAVFDLECNQLLGTFFGGDEWDSVYNLEVDAAGNIYINGETSSPDFPVTNGPLPSSPYEFFTMKLDPNGNIIYNTFFDINGGNTYINDYEVGDDGSTFATSGYVSLDDNIFTTDGSTANGSFGYLVRRYDPSGNLVYSKIFDYSGYDESYGIVAVGAELFVSFETNSPEYPTTDGTSLGSGYDSGITKLDANGNVIFTTLIDGYFNQVETAGSFLYAWGATRSTDFYTTDGSTVHPNSVAVASFVRKYDLSGNLIYSTILSTDIDLASASSDFIIQNEEVYFLLEVDEPDINFPVVNGLPYSGTDESLILVKLDQTGALAYSTFYGGNGYVDGRSDITINENGEIFMIIAVDPGATVTTDYPTTDGTQGTGVYIVKYNADGSLCAATVVNDFGADVHRLNTYSDFYAEGNTVYFGIGDGNLSTDGTTFNGGDADYAIVKYSFCPDETAIPTDELSPVSQTVCSNELVEQLFGEKIVIESTGQAQFFVGGVPKDQDEVPLNYQWQFSSTASGPWTNVSGALGQLQNYAPAPTSQTVYYRRLTQKSECCGGEIVSTSSVSEILVTNDIAPEVDAGGTFYICPGEDIQIGGSPSVTGGAGGYTYDWNDGEYSVANPTVNLTESSILTLRVEDQAGCIQADQATVNVYSADAGPDKSVCNGAATTVGGSPLPGVSIVDAGSPLAGQYSVAYTWTGDTGNLTCTNCPKPNASPVDGTTDTYSLEVTIYQPDGTSCSTMDEVMVSSNAAPSTPDFAGADAVVCKGEDYTIGAPAEADFDYAWSPGVFVTSTTGVLDQSSLVFNSGLPDDEEIGILGGTSNPITYIVAAEKDGCVTYDQVTVAVIEARAHGQGPETRCGPIVIGFPDRTPSIDETYSWRIIPELTTGDSGFTGAMDEPQIPVSATSSGETAYELAVTHTFAGVTATCLDTVYITPCGCDMIYRVENGGCADFDLSQTGIQAYASIGEDLDNSDFTFDWSPQAGLNTYDNNSVQLTDNIARTYTVTATSIIDPNTVCTMMVPVNQPDFAVPAFNATSPIAACQGDVVNIGDPLDNPGYTYAWNPAAPLNFSTISNPEASVNQSTNFTVTVTDNVTRCFVEQEVSLDLGVVAAAGEDFYVCDNSIITLGKNLEQAGYTYSWSPVLAPSDYRNGTNQNSAQPEVFVATDLTFVLTVTSPAPESCVSTDEVEVFVNPIPENFTMPDVDFCPSITPIILGFDNSDGTGNNNVPNGYTYSWSPASLLNNSSLQNPTVTTVPSIDVPFTLTIFSGGGCNNKATQNLVLSAGVTAPETASNQTVCVNESVSIGSDNNPTGAGISYLWSPDDGNLSDVSAPNPDFTSMTTGSYTYTVTKEDNGCTTISEVTFNVIEVDIPEVENSYSLCMGETVVLGPETVNAVYVYQWEPATGLDDASISNPIFNGTTSTNYTLTIISSAGCIVEMPVSVSVSTLPVPEVSLDDITECNALASSVILNPTVTSSGTYSYQWTPSTYLSNANVEDPTFFIPGAGSYEYVVEVTDQTSGCSVLDTTIIIVSNNEVTAPVIAGDQSVCQGENPTAFTVTTPAASTGQITYQWQSSTISCMAGFTDLGAASTVFTPYDPDVLYVDTYFRVITTTDNGLCADTSNCVTVTINPLATADAGNSQVACANGMITLAGSIGGSATSASWSAPSGSFGDANSLTSTYSPSITSGSVTLTLTTDDPAGACPLATSTVEITVIPLPTTPTITSPVNNDCPATTVNLNNIAIPLAPSASGGIFEWRVADSSTSALVSTPTAIGAGTYYLFEKSPDGCYSASESLVVSITTCCPTQNCGTITVTKN